MKKKIVALACAMVMTLAMGMTVCAAPSVDSGSISNPSVDTDSVVGSCGSASTTAPAVTVVTTPSQTVDYTVVADMVSKTTVTSDVEAAYYPVAMDVVNNAVAFAQKNVGANAFIATIFDLDVPSGQAATFTVGCPNVFAGQKVVVLHQKSNGEWEIIKPSNVANGSVTFSMTSYSPVAIVVDGTASKTADMSVVVAVMAMICLAGVAVCAKKVRFN